MKTANIQTRLAFELRPPPEGRIRTDRRWIDRLDRGRVATTKHSKYTKGSDDRRDHRPRGALPDHGGAPEVPLTRALDILGWRDDPFATLSKKPAVEGAPQTFARSSLPDEISRSPLAELCGSSPDVALLGVFSE